MSSPRVLILYNEPVLPPGHPDAESEREVVETASFVDRTLTAAGLEVGLLAASYDPEALLAGLRREQPDVVFNLFEGTADDGDNEAHVAGLLEWLGIPFTGSAAPVLSLARRKHLVKSLLVGAGLPTPSFFVADELPVVDCPLGWPVIVKPATQDASVGLDQGSVISDLPRLNERIRILEKRYGRPVLVEEFIPGREFNVALVETSDLQVLPISEILFLEGATERWPIVTYEAKWKPGSQEDRATPYHCPAEIDPELAERLETLSHRAFRLLGCRDYARVDFRVRQTGEPYILEINPNPDFHPTAGLERSLAAAGLTHEQFTVQLVRTALDRKRPKSRIEVYEV
jgi:D-alanine-D-alanine ligase